LKQQLKTADLIFEAMQRQEKLHAPLVVKTGGLCDFDGRPLVALSAIGVRHFKRQSIPTCLKCEAAYHPLNGLGSRDFDGTDDIIDCQSPATLDNVNTGTLFAWIYPDSVGEGGYGTIFFCSTSGADGGRRIWGRTLGTNTVDAYFNTDTASGYAVTTDNTITTGAWQCVASTYSNAGVPDRKPRIYRGLPTTAIAECSYTTQTAATGTIASDAALDKTIGACHSGAQTFDGKIAHVALYNVKLTLNELISLQFGEIITAGLIGYWPLWGVASPEPDLSGNVNSGTVTGALLGNHAPLGRYTPYKHRWVPLLAIEYINVTDSATGTDTVVSVEEWLTITDTAVGTDIAYLLGEVLVDGLRLDHCLRIKVTEPTNLATKPVSDALPRRIYLGKQGRTLELEGWVATVAELNVIEALADGAVHEIQLPTGSRVSVHIPEARPTRPIEPGKYPYTIRAVERMY
jgi:hypothetical protein